MQLLPDESRARWILALVAVGAFAALLGLEIATEEDGVTGAELALEVLELLLTIAAAAGVALLAGSMHRQHEEKMALMRDLDAARLDGEGWRQRAQAHLNGLAAAIHKQLALWKLTEAECEVALLILKGFSHKEIAALRGTSEATVRQQAGAAYEKSGLKGRAPFCAFFLEDLLPSDAINAIPNGAAAETAVPHRASIAGAQTSAN
jgi:DNA-binding CsgD family transcriptional regulator